VLHPLLEKDVCPPATSAPVVRIFSLCGLQWWTNHKSNHSPKSQIIGQKDFNHHAKPQFKSHKNKSNPNHLNPSHKSNQIMTVPDSTVSAPPSGTAVTQQSLQSGEPSLPVWVHHRWRTGVPRLPKTLVCSDICKSQAQFAKIRMAWLPKLTV